MAEIVSIVLLAVFVLLFFLALLAALAGFIKGLYKTTVKTLLIGVLLGVFIFLTPSITQAIGSIDFSRFGFSFDFNGQTIVLTSIQETLANIITATGLISPMNGISIYQTAIALANSLLSYVIFFVLVLLTQLFIWLLTAIVYNGIFRWFLPVETAKQRRERKEMSKEMRSLTDGIYFDEEEKDEENAETPAVVDPYLQEELLRGQEPGTEYAEPFAETEEDSFVPDDYDGDDDFQEANTRKRLPLLRFPGAILGACCEFVLAMVLISPFTALARTALDHRKTVNTLLESMDLGTQVSSEDISSSLDNVENSLVYKLLGIANFDTSIMNSVSRVEIGGEQVSFNSLVSSVLDIASPLIDNGAITFENGVTNITINFSLLLNQTTVTTLLDLVIANPVVMALIPPAIDIGVNTLSSQSLPLGELDFGNIDWSDQLKAVSQIYSDVYGTGVIDSLFSADGKELTMDNFLIKTSKESLSDEDFAKSLEKYTSALYKLGNLEVMKKNLPQIFASVGTYLNSTGITVLPTDVEDYAGIDWGKDLSLIGSSALRLCRLLDVDISKGVDFKGALGDVSQDSFKTTEEAQAFVSEMEDILCGHTAEDGEEVLGLLDCGILGVMKIGDVMKSVMTMIPALSDYAKNVDFSVLNNIQDIKKEFRALFEIVNTILDPEFPIDIKEGFSGIDFSSQEVADALANVLNSAQASELFKEMYPSIIKSFLTNEDLKFSDYLFGLTPYDFNFDADDSFTRDFESLVRLMPKVYKLYKVMDEGGSTEEKFKKIDADTVGEVLTLVAQSEFFNPDLKTGISVAESGRNFNVYVLLSNLFDRSVFKDLGLVAPSLETIGKIQWTSSEGTGEIDRIVSLLKDAQKNASFLLNGAQGEVADQDALSSMMKNGMDSELLQPSILAIINDSMNSFFSEMGINKTINQMRTELWKEDVDRLVDILTLAGGMDFSDPDFFDNIDVKRLNALLTTLYNTNFIANCFGTPLAVEATDEVITESRNRNFSELFAALIQSQDLFGQLGIESFNYGSLYVDTWSDGQEEESLDDPESEKTYTLTISGDIAGLCDFFSSVQDVGIDSISGGKLPENFLTEKVTSESKKSKVVMSLLSTVLTNTISELGLDDTYKSAIEKIDFYQLADMTEAEINAEFAFIETIYNLSQPSEGKDTSALEDMFSDIFNMDDTQHAEFTNLMKLIGNSKLMTTIREGQTRSPIGELLYNIFSTTEGSSGTSFLAQITLAEDAKDYGPYFDGLLKQVTDWEEELMKLDSFLRSFTDLGVSDPDALDSIFDKPGNEVTVKDLLKKMNGSALFHRVPISIFRDNIESSNENGMSSLFCNPTTKENRTIDFLVHLTSSEEDVNFWNNEIEHAVNLLFSVSDFLESGFDGVGIGEGGIQLDLLYEVGSMELFRPVRANMVYNLIINTAVGATKDVVDDVFKNVFVFNEDINAYRIEKIFFENPALLDSEGKMDELRTKADIGALEQVLNTVLANLETIATGSAEDLFTENGLIVSFQDLTTKTFYEYEGKTCRSLLASELVAGLMKQILKNESILAMINPDDPSSVDFGFTDIDFYGKKDDYPMVNPIEGRAIDSFLNALYGLVPTGGDTTMIPSLTIEEARSLLASLSVPTKTGDPIFDAFAEEYRASELVNSRFGNNETVLNILKTVPVYDETTPITTIGALLGEDFDPSKTSFLDALESSLH